MLDEPTNDLDLETLELLEEQLVQFDGTLLVVSHDRAFLNNVVTSTIVFEPAGVREYVGGYDDWLRQRSAEVAEASQRAATLTKERRPATTKEPRAASRRRTYKEKLELESLPARIAELDAEIAKLHADMARPEFYQQPPANIAQKSARLKDFDQSLAAAYARWEELEQLGE
jgi:ATP-binding cassette subfamily F protein uup